MCGTNDLIVWTKIYLTSETNIDVTWNKRLGQNIDIEATVSEKKKKLILGIVKKKEKKKQEEQSKIENGM